MGLTIVENGVVVRPRARLAAELVSESFGSYLERRALNWSSLKNMAKSPAHYRHALTEKQDTLALKIGGAFHTAVLEPSQFKSRYAQWDGGARRGKEWDAFEDECASAGQVPLSLKEVLLVQNLATAVRQHKQASVLLGEGLAEVSVLWEVRRDGLPGDPQVTWKAKSRIDFLSQSAIVDLKSAKDASPDGFSRAAWSLGYLGQAAFYTDAVEAVTGERRPFYFVAVEKQAPFVVQVYAVPDDLIDVGRDHYLGLLDRLALCQRENRWPGYADGIATLELPRWATPDDEDMSDTDIEFSPEASDGL